MTKFFYCSYFLFFYLIAVSAQNDPQSIGNIEKQGVWYKICNERGKNIKTVGASIGELLGFGSQFFIVKHGCWYNLYNLKAQKYKTLQTSIGEIVSIASNSFVVRKGVWLHTYDSNGNKISTRQAK